MELDSHKDDEKDEENTQGNENQVLEEEVTLNEELKNEQLTDDQEEKKGEGEEGPKPKPPFPPKEVAIKVFRKKDLTPKTVARLIKEKEILNFGSEIKNIVHLHGVAADNDCIYFVLELCPNGTLQELIEENGPLDIRLVKFYAAQIVNLLQFLHARQVVFRQVLADKFLLGKDRQLKLSSFMGATMRGISLQEHSEILHSKYCFSPELILENSVSPSCDFFGFGWVLAHMLKGSPPFQADNQGNLFARILSSHYNLDGIEDYNAIDLINHLLCGDPKERIDSWETVKSHPFFLGTDFEIVTNRPPPSGCKTLVNICTDFIRKNCRVHWNVDFKWEGHLPKDLVEKIFYSMSNLQEMRISKDKYLRSEETIIRTGWIWRKSFFRKKNRYKLILTSLPRLVVVDPQKLIQKEEICCIDHTYTQLLSKESFMLTTGKKTVSFELDSKDATKWVQLINKFIL